MKAVVRTALAIMMIAGLGSTAALAIGPISGEVGADYWANDVEGFGSSNLDAGAPGYRAELWVFKKFGMRAGQYESDPDGGVSSDYTNVDFMWRAFSPTENNFFAVGLGWQELDLGLLGDTSGARVAVEGRVGIGGLFYAYGHGAYAPSLDDTSGGAAIGTDVTGTELEAGVAWKMFPFVSMRGGYRMNSLDFKDTGSSSQSIDAEGFLLGLTARF